PLDFRMLATFMGRLSALRRGHRRGTRAPPRRNAIIAREPPGWKRSRYGGPLPIDLPRRDGYDPAALRLRRGDSACWSRAPGCALGPDAASDDRPAAAATARRPSRRCASRPDRVHG